MSSGEYTAEETRLEKEAELVEKSDSTDTIKVSSSAHTVFFYVDLATKFLVDHERVHLSGLGKTVTTVVTLAEILKKDGIANIVAINTSLIPVPPEQRKPGSIKTNKAKIDITIAKSEGFNAYITKKKAQSDENKQIRDSVEQMRAKMQEKLKREAEAQVNS